MKSLVITSIHPAESVLSQYLGRGYELVIVGDKKSPPHYSIESHYLDITAQLKMFPEFAARLPFHHYARKNLGYLYAIKHGASVVAEVDDDITPLPNWGLFATREIEVITSPRWPNLLQLFLQPTTGETQSGLQTTTTIWARGFPLDLVNQPVPVRFGESISASRIWVWQNWTAGAPDIDAVCRLTLNPVPTFMDRAPVTLSGTLAPFNSQNTTWMNRNALAFAYLPSFVSFRYTDILRSFVAQRAINAAGGFVAYGPCDTISQRNPHDPLDDLRQEAEMYHTVHKVERTLDDVKWTGEAGDLIRAYEALTAASVTSHEEIALVRLWLMEFEQCLK